MNLARAFLAVSLLAAFAAAGCSDNPVANCFCGTPPPAVETPQQALARFEHAYETEDLDAYADLLADDFHYRFSAQADPLLVSQYGLSWGVTRDTSSTSHLFTGFTNGNGDYVPAADSLTLSLTGARYETDPAHADSTRHYVVADSATTLLHVWLGAGSYEYEVDTIHSFYLVRGDAAVMAPGQSADSTRWYLRRQDDLASALTSRPGRYAPAHVMPATGTTWGAIKSQYLE